MTSEKLRPGFSSYKDYSKYNTDILIVTMNSDGRIVKGHNINN